ncbi:MAG: glycosyltransferase [Bacteroidales bacterium]
MTGLVPQSINEPGRREKPVVLVCPLNWGLGHAARCIPVIREFLVAGCQVVVAAEGGPLALLKEEFTGSVRFLLFPGMNVQYSSGKNMVLNMAKQLPTLLYAIWQEHRQLKKILQDTSADIVLSDNRYGLWAPGTQTVFMTHQVFIQSPPGLKYMEPLLYAMNRYFIKKFDHCWIPDFPGSENLSGILSHKKELKQLRFIGPLSRFEAGSVEGTPNRTDEDYILIILSGPEPQRTLLERELTKQVDAAALKAIFVRGLINGLPAPVTSLRNMLNHASSPRMKTLIAKARAVVCRPGYSTLMDLSVFGKKAVVIPTPGQTEQEYLGRMLQEQGFAQCVSQDQIDLREDLKRAERLQGIPRVSHQLGLLTAAVQDLLNQV